MPTVSFAGRSVRIRLGFRVRSEFRSCVEVEMAVLGSVPVLMSLTVSVDVKQHWTMLTHRSQFVPNMSTDIRGH